MNVFDLVNMWLDRNHFQKLILASIALFIPEADAETELQHLRGLAWAFDDPDPRVQKTAIVKLNSSHLLEAQASQTKYLDLYVDFAPQIAELLKDQDSEVRDSAISSLGMMGEAAKQFAPQIAERLWDQDSHVRSSAANALGKMGEAAKPFAPLIAEMLRDQDSHVRSSAANALGKMGEAAKPFAPLIAEMLRDQDSHVRSSAANALGKMGEAAKMVAPLIAEMLKDQDSHVRFSALSALGRMGEAAKMVAPQIAEMLKDQDIVTRDSAVTTLGRMGGAAKMVVLQIAELLKDQDFHVRSSAANTLGKMEEAAKVVVPQIAELLKDQDSAIRGSAVRALGKMGEAAKPFAPQIAELLKDQDSEVRDSAISSLGMMGEAAKQFAPQIAEMLKDQDGGIRDSSVRVLGAMGEAAKPFAPQIAELLKDLNSGRGSPAITALDPMAVTALPITELYRTATISSAVTALITMGEAAKPFAPQIAELLKDQNSAIRSSAVSALGTMGETAKSFAPQIAELLKDQNSAIRSSAVSALGKMGEAAKSFAPQIAELLKDQDSKVRDSAISSLGMMGEAAKQFTPQIAEMLKDQDGDVRSSAINALGKMGEDAKPFAPQIAEMLKDQDGDVRDSATSALGRMGEAAKVVVPQIAEMLKDQDGDVRDSAASALGRMGEAAKVVVPQIAEMLKDQDGDVRSSAVSALGRMGETAKMVAPQIAKLLKDQDIKIRSSAENTLVAMCSDDIEVVTEILNQASMYANRNSKLKILAYQLSGSFQTLNNEMQTFEIIQWLANRDSEEVANPEELVMLDVSNRIRLLGGFRILWTPEKTHRPLRADIAKRISEIVRTGSDDWQTTNIELLKDWEKLLAEESFRDEANTVKGEIDLIYRGEKMKWWTQYGSAVICLHFLFWICLLVAYPQSPKVQAVFFWNPWVRKIAGLGYVGLLLAWVPFLRQRLFAPFRELLLVDAALDELDAQDYFADLKVRDTDGNRHPIDMAIPQIEGLIELEGESGLGKSMFARHLLSRSKHLAVWLPAEKCEKGVMAAIQQKLHGPAKDETYLNSLTFSGAFDVVIDGINEVDPNTRAEIRNFVEQNFHGNVILTTQPIDWKSPSGATKFVLEPLDDDAIKQFLLSRRKILRDHSTVGITQFSNLCQAYLVDSLAPNQPKEEIVATKRALSNPMELTIAAQLIADGQKPDLFRLQSQQYETMAKEFSRTHSDATFALEKFSEIVYSMRVSDRFDIPADEFNEELLCMERYKMVVSRKTRDAAGKTVFPWYFRHDKIMEFFIVQTFLKHDDRALEHLGESRFRGVYFLLATQLPFEAAMNLREELLQHTAKTRDTTVLAPFVELLNSRKLRENSSEPNSTNDVCDP